MAGADGLIIETHNNPEEAMSDGKQSLFPEQFKSLMNNLKPVLEIMRENTMIDNLSLYQFMETG